MKKLVLLAIVLVVVLSVVLQVMILNKDKASPQGETIINKPAPSVVEQIENQQLSPPVKVDAQVDSIMNATEQRNNNEEIIYEEPIRAGILDG